MLSLLFNTCRLNHRNLISSILYLGCPTWFPFIEEYNQASIPTKFKSNLFSILAKNYFIEEVLIFFSPPEQREERLLLPMSTVMTTVSKTSIPAHVRSVVFDVCCDDADGNDVEVPFVEYHLPTRPQ